MQKKGVKIRCLQVASEDKALNALQGVHVDSCDVPELIPKMIHLNILLEGIDGKQACLIKQGITELGGYVAADHETIGRSHIKTDLIVMGTLQQINRFTEKIARQPICMSHVSQEISQTMSNFFLESVKVRTSRREITVGERTLIMGILNVTPDSFSDGGRFADLYTAVEQGVRMAEEGADIIDIGGESTRPGSESVTQAEELRRVIPVIAALAAKIDVPLSIDTMKAVVAREALAAGAEIVNDVSSMKADKRMASVVADAGAAIILMHMRGKPKTMQTGDLSYRSVCGEIIEFLRNRIEKAGEMGIDPVQIMVDPGLGFGKTPEDNLRLIRYLGEFKSLGRPIVAGVSRKSFIGHVTGGGPQERIEGTAAAVTAAILNGSRIVRVHDVGAMKKVAAMADALSRA